MHSLEPEDQPAHVVIIGLGYVGLTLGVALARRGLRVSGIEKRRSVVDLTNRGIPHFSEYGLGSALWAVVKSGQFRAYTDGRAVPQGQYYILTVGTPLKAGTTDPRIDMIEDASQEVAAHMADGAVVILRSTVRIGTTRSIVNPVLAATGRRYHLAMCPERTLEGDALRELATLPQIIGGMNGLAADKAAMLFSKLTHTIVKVADPETAEMIKLVDNTSRDVRFAFANEVARACDAVGINGHDVIRFGKLGYARTDVALPGLVGGPCLEKDPHILLASLAPLGIHLDITAASRRVNEQQPGETVAAIVAKLRARSSGPFVAVVAGIAFKGRPETDDMRGSMSLHVIDELIASGAFSEIRIYDPVAKREPLQALRPDLSVCDDLYNASTGADVVIVANNHPFFSNIDLDRLSAIWQSHGFVYDYWNNLGQHPKESLDGRYVTVGNLAGKFS